MNLRPGRRFLVLLAAVSLAAALPTAGCGPTVDLSKGLEVVDVSTGFYDAGIQNGMNKLVPMIAFRVKNVSDQDLVVLQVSLSFRRVNNPSEEWGTGFVMVTGSKGLAPGATTDLFTVKSQNGYTGIEPRVDMLQNSKFVDAKVLLSAKYASHQLTLIAEYPIERRLITK
jgi:hypothetical protein